ERLEQQDQDDDENDRLGDLAHHTVGDGLRPRFAPSCGCGLLLTPNFFVQVAFDRGDRGTGLQPEQATQPAISFNSPQHVGGKDHAGSADETRVPEAERTHEEANSSRKCNLVDHEEYAKSDPAPSLAGFSSWLFTVPLVPLRHDPRLEAVVRFRLR